jgi:hypothetical protein
MNTRRPKRPERRHSEEEARRWAAELIARFRSAGGPAQREQVLRELDRPLLLDEDGALELYRLQPGLASGFISRHAPRGRRAVDAQLPWQRLMREALGQGDDELHFALYRAQVPAEQWARDTIELARRVASPERLCEELERRHPQRWRADIGPHLHALAQLRGEHILSYLEHHAADVWSARRRAGRAEMAQLARRRGWWELWAELTISCTSAAEYDAEVMALVLDQASPEAQVRQQLLQLAGASGAAEVTGGPSARPLKDATLVALYQRFPHYVRGPFRARLAPSVKQPRTTLLRRAVEQRDDELIDLLASHLAAYQPRSGDTALMDAVQLAADYYTGLSLDDAGWPARAVRILKRVPLRTIQSLRELERGNALARVLFARVRSAAQDHVETVAELLAAPDRQVLSLGLDTLAQAGARSARVVDANLELLLEALARPVNRPAASRVLRLLRAVDSEESARRVLACVREKMSVAGDRGPGEAFAALAGALLQRFPGLRESGEQPVVYRRRLA